MRTDDDPMDGADFDDPKWHAIRHECKEDHTCIRCKHWVDRECEYEDGCTERRCYFEDLPCE